VSRAPRRHLIVAAAAALLALAGCGDDGGSSPRPPAAAPLPAFAPAGKVTCSEEAYTASAPDGGWTHPSQNFYAPGDKPMPSETDLQHLMSADSAVIVRYRADAPADAREALRGWAGTLAAIVALPGKTTGDVAVEGFTSNRRLVCDGVDAAQLKAFADRRGAVQSVPHDTEG
jgi:hypothetical protein